MTLAYVCNRYPAVSNTFILREVRALREHHPAVHTFSVRRPGPGDVLASADREEQARTTYLVPARPGRLARAHLHGLVRHPIRYLQTLRRALGLAPPGVRGLAWQALYFGEALLLWDHCRRLGVRHLHAHFAYVASDDALLAAHMGDWTWSFSMHGPPEFYDVPGTRLAAKVADADAVVCISDFCRSQLMGLVPESCWSKLHVVRCGVNLEDFAPATRNGDRPSNRLRLLMVARLARVKGHIVLLQALAELRRRGVAVDAVLIGEGPERGAIEEWVRHLGLADHVRLAGAVGQDEIRSEYARADAFCLPSFAEGLPVVLMEAMAMELPVVATRIMGIPELVEEGVSGMLVTAGRVDELADALHQLAQDPERGHSLGRAGREKVLGAHDLKRTSAELRDVLAGMGAAAA
ncbi:MAG: glycosyltransferase family 4 protein [Solirubrobacteraceae bacterium]